MILVTSGLPPVQFSPITVVDLRAKSTPTIVKLQVVGRFCNVDPVSHIIDYYVQLSNDTADFYLPASYTDYLCAGQGGTVLCSYTKLTNGVARYNHLAIAEWDKPHLSIIDDLDHPLAQDNVSIPKIYSGHLYKEFPATVNLVLLAIGNNVVSGCGCTNVLDGKFYKKVKCDLDILLNSIQQTKPTHIQYRKLKLNGETYITDLEVAICP